MKKKSNKSKYIILISLILLTVILLILIKLSSMHKNISEADANVFEKTELLSQTWIKDWYYYSYDSNNEFETNELYNNVFQYPNEIKMTPDYSYLWLNNPKKDLNIKIWINLKLDYKKMDKKLFAKVDNTKWCSLRKCYGAIIWLDSQKNAICNHVFMFQDIWEDNYINVRLSNLYSESKMKLHCKPNMILSELKYIRFNFWIDNSDWKEGKFYVTDFMYDNIANTDKYIEDKYEVRKLDEDNYVVLSLKEKVEIKELYTEKTNK